MVHKIEEPSREQPNNAMQMITATTVTVHHPPASAPVADYHLQVDNDPMTTPVATTGKENKFTKWIFRDTRKDGKSYTQATQTAPQHAVPLPLTYHRSLFLASHQVVIV
jgi:hypothetical protein